MRRTAVALVMFFVTAIVAHAAVISLTPDGTGDYPDIQSALQVAVNGDEIVLADGIYTGEGNRNIDFLGKQVILRSASGDAQACIIDAGGIHGNLIPERGLIFVSGEGPQTEVRDLTVRNADSDGPCPDCEGGALLIRDSSPTFHNVTFSNNYALSGAGAFIDGREEMESAPEFYNCHFLNGTGHYGVGIELASADVRLYDCVIAGNSISDYGIAAGVRLFNGATMLMDGCTVADNSAMFGSVFELYYAEALIRNSIIANNRGSERPIYETAESSVVVRYSTIANNDGIDWPPVIRAQQFRFGNLNMDPGLQPFTTHRGGLTLRADSPCIDAGDPSAPQDPDGTRRDMGAYWFDQTVPQEADNETPVQFASNGGSSATELPGEFAVQPLTPNPFNAATTLSFTLPDRARVSVRVMDVLGRERALVSDAVFSAGEHRVSIDGGDLASGIYFVVVDAGSFGRKVQKAVLTK